MQRTLLTKWMILAHRWMGVGFCLLFFAWFASGIVMMYCHFPEVGAAERLAHAAALDAGRTRISPAQALAALGATAPPTQARLESFDGRPVYRFTMGRRTRTVFADDGQPLATVSQAEARRIASVWTGLSSDAAVFRGAITQDDQWTVYSSVRPYGPFWKFAWPNGEEVYVSQSTGEVVQDTTRATRWGAYLGAIPHWLYFTQLRRNARLWSATVVWLSGTATLASLLGLAVALWLYSPSKRYRYRGAASCLPYAGQRRWHVVLGLIFGAVTCAWVFSGYLSMDPIAWLSVRDAPNIERMLRGGRLNLGRFADKDPAEAIREAAASLPVKELELTSFGGAAYYIAHASPRRTLLIPMNGSPQPSLDTGAMVETVRRAAAPTAIAATRLVTRYELYYMNRQSPLPLPALYVQLNDRGHSAYYLDPKTGAVVESYGPHSRWNRWLYHGLHSMDWPWLYERRPAWDIVMIVLLLGGTALSFTSVVLAWRVVRRKFVPVFRKGESS